MEEQRGITWRRDRTWALSLTLGLAMITFVLLTYLPRNGHWPAPSAWSERPWFGWVWVPMIALYWIAQGLAGLLSVIIVSPNGIEHRLGRRRVWFVGWDQYLQWRWVWAGVSQGDPPLTPRLGPAPWRLVIETTDGDVHCIRVSRGQMQQGRVAPSRATARLLAALWEFGPRTGRGWSETAGYPLPPTPPSC